MLSYTDKVCINRCIDEYINNGCDSVATISILNGIKQELNDNKGHFFYFKAPEKNALAEALDYHADLNKDCYIEIKAVEYIKEKLGR